MIAFFIGLDIIHRIHLLKKKIKDFSRLLQIFKKTTLLTEKLTNKTLNFTT